MKLGDAVAIPAQIVAKGLDFTIGPQGFGFYQTPIQGCSGCGHRQQALNDFSDSIYSRFWKPTINQGDNMADERPITEFLIVVSVWAEDAYEPNMLSLVNYIKQQGGSILGVNPRPQGPQQMVPQTPPAQQTIRRIGTPAVPPPRG
jgi:hypothetical protein